METTYTNSREKAATQTEKISKEGKISRKALVGFVTGASIPFGAALIYCAKTSHMNGVAFLAGAAVLIAIYAVTTYRSFK